MEKITYEGFDYIIINDHNNPFYGRESVYHILTNNPKWCGALIPDLCGYPNVMSKGEHSLNYKRNPTFENHLKPYYTVDLIEDNRYENQFDGVDTDCYYEFKYIEPYDD